MKFSTSVQIAAAGILSMASMANAQSACAVTCFTNVITEHPPLDCKEANMYLCFCKMSSLQNYFRECAAKDCPSTAEQTIKYGYDICKDMGSPIVDAPASSSKPAEESKPTTKAEEAAKPTTKAEEAPKPTTKAEDAAKPTTKAGEAAQTTAAAPTTKSSGSAAPSGQKPPAASPTPTQVIANAGNAVAVSGFVAAAAAVVAVFQL